MANITVFRQRNAGLICTGDGVMFDGKECMVIEIIDPAQGTFKVMDHEGGTLELHVHQAEPETLEPEAEPAAATHEAPPTIQ